VYRDAQYPFSWVQPDVSKQVSDYLTRRSDGVRFSEVDAKGLRMWMESVVSSGTAHRTVLVMSQDVMPDTVAESPTARAMVRKYLNSGGRVVWIGDVPFFYQGMPRKGLVPLPTGEITLQGKRWDLSGMYGILGIASAAAVPMGLTKVTPDGQTRGIHTPWYSERPLAPPLLRNGIPLAETELLPALRLEDILPQQAGATRAGSIAADVIAFNEFVDALKGLFGTMVLVVATLYAVLTFVPEFADSIPLRAIATGVLLSTGIFGFFVWRRHRLARTRIFYGGWLLRFGAEGEFVRIWDTPDLRPDPAMLEELEHIACFGRVDGR